MTQRLIKENEIMTAPYSLEINEALKKLLTIEEMEGDVEIEIKMENPVRMIIEKRIEVMKLPVVFTNMAFVAAGMIVDRPGFAVFLLIDILNRCQDVRVNVESIMELYPNGFYEYEAMIEFIEGEVKTQKVKYSEIY